MSRRGYGFFYFRCIVIILIPSFPCRCRVTNKRESLPGQKPLPVILNRKRKSETHVQVNNQFTDSVVSLITQLIFLDVGLREWCEGHEGKAAIPSATGSFTFILIFVECPQHLYFLQAWEENVGWETSSQSSSVSNSTSEYVFVSLM
jgi:hypothetical protein